VGVTDWFRRVFSSSTDGGRDDDFAVRHEEDAEPSSDTIDDAGLQRIRAQRGATGFAGLEVAEAAEDAVEGADAPPDPAP
jgi:hypothetical protein